MNLSKLSSQELRTLQVDIDKEIASRRKEEQKQAKRELKEVAGKYRFALEDLLKGSTRAAKRGSRGGSTVRFRHPDDPSKTWTGRGRKPIWVKEWEAAGHSVEELRAG